MKAKTRMLWMKLHAYLACFFLPLTLLYILSGVLYLFDIKGGPSSKVEYDIDTPWIAQQSDAKQLVLAKLSEQDHIALPPDYFPEENMHEWYGYKQDVILKSINDGKAMELIVIEHDFVHQLLLIHKGFAGPVFWLLAILLGLSLIFSLASGVVLSLQLPQVKVPSMWALGGGALVLVVAFV